MGKARRANTVIAIALAVLGLLLTGCGGSAALDGQGPAKSPAGAVTTSAAPAAEGPSPVASRPYGFKTPKGYDEGHPTPLVILLHGYTADGPRQDAYFRLSPLADEKTFLLAYPNGTVDIGGQRFWNATDACCDFLSRGVDDVAYLDAVIDDASSRYNVDPARIFLVGHSNGGFMSHRFACDRAPRVAAIVSLAGMQWKDKNRCGPASRLSVLQVDGTNDDIIKYGGGQTPKGPYPGAEETVATWAEKNGCTGTLSPSGQALDLESGIAGEETSVARYSGCGAVDVELWTINGGGHIPALNERWAPAIWDFLSAHPKPVA